MPQAPKFTPYRTACSGGQHESDRLSPIGFRAVPRNGKTGRGGSVQNGVRYGGGSAKSTTAYVSHPIEGPTRAKSRTSLSFAHRRGRRIVYLPFPPDDAKRLSSLAGGILTRLSIASSQRA